MKNKVTENTAEKQFRVNICLMNEIFCILTISLYNPLSVLYK